VNIFPIFDLTRRISTMLDFLGSLFSFIFNFDFNSRTFIVFCSDGKENKLEQQVFYDIYR
jgi:serine/threonine protein phosphatase PrpC